MHFCIFEKKRYRTIRIIIANSVATDVASRCVRSHVRNISRHYLGGRYAPSELTKRYAPSELTS